MSSLSQVGSWIVIMGAMSISDYACAAEPVETVLTIGTGQFSCGKFIDYHKENNSAQLDMIVQWFWGFLTAYN
jgi:hypothetical protein